MKKLLIALLGIVLLMSVLGCPPAKDPGDAFGPGPDKPAVENGDNGVNGDVVPDGNGDVTDPVVDEPETPMDPPETPEEPTEEPG